MEVHRQSQSKASRKIVKFRRLPDETAMTEQTFLKETKNDDGDFNAPEVSRKSARIPDFRFSSHPNFREIFGAL
jgi:hypothetical protein